MEVRQPPRVHQHPPGARVHHAAVVPDEPAPAPLVVHPALVQRDVDRVRGRVVVWAERRLLVRPIAHDEVHQRARGVVVVPREDGLLQGAHVAREELQPVAVPRDLRHVDVAGGDRLVAALEALVVVRARRPLAVAFH